MEVTLQDWQIVCVESATGPQLRLAGHNTADGQYRISSMMVSFDPERREAETASGKRYLLHGDRGAGERIARVIHAYRRRHGMIEVRIVSENEAFDIFQLQTTQISDYGQFHTLISG